MARVVVADAGPLIAFGRIGRLDLLDAVLGPVIDAFRANGYHLSANLVEAVRARAGEQTSATP